LNEPGQLSGEIARYHVIMHVGCTKIEEKKIDQTAIAQLQERKLR
jgi:hypothetical protein